MFCVYYFFAMQKQASRKDSIALLAIITGQAVNSMQMLGVFDILLTGWSEPFETCLSVASLLCVGIDLLHVNCVALERFFSLCA